MSNRLCRHPGIVSRRRAVLAIAGTGLLFSGQAKAADVEAVADSAEPAADAAAADQGQGNNDDIVVTGPKYRINTLNSRLPDVRDAPQSISIIPREVMEQQSASTLRDVLRNVS